MIRSLSVSFLSLACIIVLASPRHLPAQKVDSSWVDSLKAGQRLASASGKPMFVVFRCVR